MMLPPPIQVSYRDDCLADILTWMQQQRLMPGTDWQHVAGSSGRYFLFEDPDVALYVIMRWS
jgi:hypothetical protein